MDLLESYLRALIVAGALGAVCSACVPIDRTPLRETTVLDAALREADRISDVESAPIRAGAARVDMTPTGSPPLAGYGNRLGRPSEGVHDRLFARALALQAEDRLIMLVSLDLLAITDDMVESIETDLRRRIPLGPESLFLTATHTHSSFGGVARRVLESFATGEYDEDLFRFLIDRVVAAASQAYWDMVPAEVAWGATAAPERIVNRMNRSGFNDPELPFLQVRRIDGTPIAQIVSFAAHATVLKAGNFRLSADYPGAVSRRLEAEAGVALFLAGAVADQTGVPPPGSSQLSGVEAFGEDLASRVQRARADLSPTSWSREIPVGIWRLSISLPPPQIKLSPGKRLPYVIGNRLLDRRTFLTIAVIGKAVLIGVPCDLSAEIGRSWKQRAQQFGRRAVIVGFVNDYVGYVIPSDDYETTKYEARMSFNGPYMDQYLSAIVSRAFERLGAKGDL